MPVGQQDRPAHRNCDAIVDRLLGIRQSDGGLITRRGGRMGPQIPGASGNRGHDSDDDCRESNNGSNAGECESNHFTFRTYQADGRHLSRATRLYIGLGRVVSLTNEVNQRPAAKVRAGAVVGTLRCRPSGLTRIKTSSCHSARLFTES